MVFLYLAAPGTPPVKLYFFKIHTQNDFLYLFLDQSARRHLRTGSLPHSIFENKTGLKQFSQLQVLKYLKDFFWGFVMLKPISKSSSNKVISKNPITLLTKIS